MNCIGRRIITDRGAGADLEFARGVLDGGNEALRTSALPAFVNMVHETGLLPLSTSKAHRPIAFLAIGLFGKRSWRGDGPFHHGALSPMLRIVVGGKLIADGSNGAQRGRARDGTSLSPMSALQRITDSSQISC
jgi:hypothetical protein